MIHYLKPESLLNHGVSEKTTENLMMQQTEFCLKYQEELESLVKQTVETHENNTITNSSVINITFGAYETGTIEKELWVVFFVPFEFEGHTVTIASVEMPTEKFEQLIDSSSGTLLTYMIKTELLDQLYQAQKETFTNGQ